MTQNYIERYWRDATPEDAIKEPPMVARFRDECCQDWVIDKLIYWDRSDTPWHREDGFCYDLCQVYDAPDPGEGWRLVDTANEKGEVGDEFLTQSGVWLPECRHNGFEHGVPYRRRITPAVTYVPFTWEDRDQLRGRWIRAIDVMDTEWMITDLHIGSSGELRATSVSADELLSGFIFVDTGEPAGKKVKQ